MVWGFIKLTVFVGLAVGTGVLCATVPVGGKTIAARATELWAKPEVKGAVGEVQTRVKRGVAAAAQPPAPTPGPEAPPPRATRVDPHAVAKVITDAPVGDAFKPSEKEAVSHLIQQRARKGQPAHR